MRCAPEDKPAVHERSARLPGEGAVARALPVVRRKRLGHLPHLPHHGILPADEARFDEYVRGGIDVLYEKLIEDATEPEDYINNLYDFLEEFEERFNSNLDCEAALKMCTN